SHSKEAHVNPEDFVIGGVQLLLLVPGIVELLKAWFKLSGRVAEFTTILLGAFFIVLAQLFTSGFFPAPWDFIIKSVIVALAAVLAIPGYYKLVKRAAGWVKS
ncbi:MAG TPA: hypothetical protein VMX14_13495, partial [Anaerolineae bacterium]|nr:hypothetical protein [Anaerolineae bacterium]